MNSHLPVGRLAEKLDSLSRERVWFAIVAATAVVAWTDRVFPAVGVVPLYIPIICGACWRLGAPAGYFVALIAAWLAVMPWLEVVATPIVILRAMIRTGAYLFLAATIISFRRSYDRELFHAHRDRMTGALNKEVFHRRCAQAIEDAGHTGQTLLLAILDLDDFKAINSRDGHRAGDAVLRSFAKGASAIVRREDLLGRIGGDEFALVMRVPSMAEGLGFARDVHDRLSAVLAEARPPVTCSMGAVLIPSHAPREVSELMHLADMAMYRAKETGKNAVEVARTGGIPPFASPPMLVRRWKQEV